jgi:hypothetical protein
MVLTKIHQLVGIIPYHDSVSFMFLSMYHTLFLVVGCIMSLSAMAGDDGFDDQMSLTIGLTIPILLAYLAWISVLGCGVFIVQWRRIKAYLGAKKPQDRSVRSPSSSYDSTPADPPADQV